MCFDCVPSQSLARLMTREAEVTVIASLEHGSQLDLLIRACLRTWAAEADELLILYHTVTIVHTTL